jgi:hypothetical protein
MLVHHMGRGGYLLRQMDVLHIYELHIHIPNILMSS